MYCKLHPKKTVSQESGTLPDYIWGNGRNEGRIQCTCLFGDFGLLAFGAGAGALLCYADEGNHLAYCFSWTTPSLELGERKKTAKRW